MNTPIRSKSIPVHTTLFATLLFGFLTYYFWPYANSTSAFTVIWYLCAFIFVFGFCKSSYLLIKDYRLRQAIAASEVTTTHHGSAREATHSEIIQQKMNKPESGNLLGMKSGMPVFAPPKTPFSLIEMPPGVGKTSCYVIGSIIHKAKLGCSLLITDVKLELAPMLARQLRHQGFEVWCINPTKAYFNICGDVELNPFQTVLDTIYSEGEKRRDASTISSDYAELILPKNKDEKQPYFSQGSRRCLNLAILSQALMNPANCTPTGVYDLLSDTEKFIYRLEEIRDFLDTGIEDDPLVAYLKTESANLLHRAEKNEENFGAFLEGATQPLLPFNQSGRLAGYGQNSIHNISEIRDRQIIVFLMAPLSHIRDFSGFLSLINHNVINAGKANPSGHPVHIVAEEALNYRFNQLGSSLEVVRGYNYTADFYIQSFAGLIRLYGKEEAQAIESYMDVKIYAGLNSFDRAKFVSDMLSDMTVRKQDYSFKSQDAVEVNLSSREISRKYQQPNEILQMPKGKAWTFVRGMNPLCLDMVHYSQASPWASMLDNHPTEGPIQKSKPLFHIKYPKKGSL